MSLLRLACLLLLTGCAGFRAGDVAETSPWPLTPPAKKKAVSLVVAGTLSHNGEPGDLPPAFLENWRESTRRTYEASGLFQSVVPETSPAELRAEVRIDDAGRGNNVLAFLSGFTMLILPARAADRITVRTQFKNAQGDVLGSFEKSDETVVWMQLLLAFAAPFAWPPTVTEEMFRDLHNATLAEAHAKGIF